MARLFPGINDLATVNPAVAAQWHPSKNSSLLPTQVTAGSGKRVWWQCSKGHEWSSTVNGRNHGSNCPVCFGKKIVPGYNDLASANPQLAAEWHPTKNGDLKPSHVQRYSNKRAWWQCAKGHEWEAVIAERSRGCGCPFCSGRKFMPGHNDLATVNPKLAAEWHPSKNSDLKPSDVQPYSSKKVWWQCAQGHEWEATVSSRSQGNVCSLCSGRRKRIIE